MKYFIAIQTIFYTVLSSLASAQNENWDTYMAKFGDKPGSVLVDLGYIDRAPDRNYPYLLITGPHAQNCDRNGIPGKDEFGALEEILDATTNFITGVTPKVLVGTFTYDCERLNYYYVKDTQSIRIAIARMYNRSFQNYSYTVRIKQDPEWNTYRSFLYPDEATRNWMENDKIITTMLQSGDSLHNQREIKFPVYFRSDSERETMVVFAREKGYKYEKINLTTGAAYEIILSKTGYVKIEDIDPMTEEIKKETEKNRGFYNGWTATK
jgi:hypothetical protein